MNGFPRVTSSSRLGQAFANTEREDIETLIDISEAEIVFPEISRTSSAGKAAAVVEEREGRDEIWLEDTFNSRRFGRVPREFIIDGLEIALFEAFINVIDSEPFKPVSDVSLFLDTFKSFNVGKNSAKNEEPEEEELIPLPPPPAPPPAPPPVLLFSDVESEPLRSPVNKLLLRFKEVKFFMPTPLVPFKAFRERISLCEASNSSSERREPMPSKFESLFPSTRNTRRNFK
jgi:hypothetical protein